MNTKLRLSVIAVGVAILAGLLHILGDSEPPVSPELPRNAGTQEPRVKPREPRKHDPAWSEAMSELEADAARAAAELAQARQVAQQEHATVRGRVLSDSGSGLPARVFVAIEDADGHRVLARSVTDASGSFAMEVPYTFEEPNRSVVVGCLPTDLQRTTASAELQPGQTTTVDLRPPAGLSMRGRIVTDSGAAVPDLAIYVACGNLPVGMVSGTTFAKDDLLFATTTNGYFEARLQTDSNGEFEAKGLGEGNYAVHSLDPTWFITHKRRHEPGGPEVIEWTAFRAVSVSGDVTSTAGEPISKFEFDVRVESEDNPRYRLFGTCVDGNLFVSWKPQFGELDTGYRLRIAIEAPGHKKQESVLEIPAGDQETDVDFQLEARSRSGLILTVVGPSGSPVDFPLSADAIGRHDQSIRLSAIDLRPLGEGKYELEVPEGKWFLRVHSSAPHGRLVRWEGEVSSSTTSESTAWCALSEFGSVRFSAPQTKAVQRTTTMWVEISTLDGSRSGQFELARDAVELEGFPPGKWVARMIGGGAPTEFTVHPASETDVELE